MSLLGLIPGSGIVKGAELIAGLIRKHAKNKTAAEGVAADLQEHSEDIEAELQKAYLGTGKAWVYAPHIILQYLLDAALAFVIVFWMVESLRAGRIADLPDNLFGLAASSGGFRMIFSLFR